MSDKPVRHEDPTVSEVLERYRDWKPGRGTGLPADRAARAPRNATGEEAEKAAARAVTKSLSGDGQGGSGLGPNENGGGGPAVRARDAGDTLPARSRQYNADRLKIQRDGGGCAAGGTGSPTRPPPWPAARPGGWPGPVKPF